MKTADATKTADIAATELDLGYPTVSTSWQSDPGAKRDGGGRVLAVRTGLRAGIYLKYEIKYDDIKV
jgi:hypothetical protein